MARKFTPLYTSIWQNEDFRALSVEAQAAYFTLISQPNINSVGLLPITANRWRKLSAGWDAERLAKALEELSERFISIDEDTEELVVRTFVKWDGGYSHAQRVKAIVKDYEAIQSLSLKAVIGTALALLGVLGIATPEPPDSHPQATEVPTVPGSSYVTTTGTGNLELEPGEEAADGDIGARLNPKFCKDHQPDGTDEDCGGCARARTREERRETERQRRERERNARLAKQRDDCTKCDDGGMVTNDDGSVSHCLAHLRSVS